MTNWARSVSTVVVLHGIGRSLLRKLPGYGENCYLGAQYVLLPGCPE